MFDKVDAKRICEAGYSKSLPVHCVAEHEIAATNKDIQEGKDFFFYK